ncbi:MAG: hypothetical protein ABIL70_05870 [candidate division WOR-3 bacterium]
MVLISIFIIGLTSEQKLDSVYYNFQCIIADSITFSEDTLPTPNRQNEEETKYQSLRVNGMKEFNFDMNNGFDQGLKLAITGELEGVKIEGNLSDKASPAPTTRIADIEKMNLNVNTRNFYGGIGDLSVGLPFGVSDEIEGARAGLYSDDDSTGVNLSYALNRGRYKRMEFNGNEGKQGPYFLNGPLVYASEKVYLTEGIHSPRLLQRNEDYYLDYTQGILTFTNKNIITHNTRITVEYQQMTQDYLGIYQEGDGMVRSDDLTLKFLARRINDDSNNPLSFSFSPEEIEGLKNCGDSSTIYHIYADTSTCGNYNMVDSHFVYAGEGKGRYNVTFFYTGENQGEYIYDPQIKAFSYLGPKMGNYSPSKVITPPADNQFYGVGIEYRYVTLSLYGSNLDRNTFSYIDDQDNRAFGYNLTLQKKMKILSGSIQYVNYQKNLNLPFSRAPLNYYYLYNTDDSLNEMANFDLGFTPLEEFSMDLFYGVLNRLHHRRGVRFKPFFLYFSYEKINTLNKFGLGGSRNIGKFFLSTDWEKKENIYFFNYSSRYNISKIVNLGVSGDYYSDTTTKAITTKLDFFSIPGKIFAGHRFYNDTTFLFGNLELNLNYKNFNIRTFIQQTQKYSQKRDEIYQRVKKGTGDYIYDSLTNTYIKKIFGDYIKKTILLNEFERVIARNYTVELGYLEKFFDTKLKLNYLNEETFFNHLEDLTLNINGNEYHLETNLRQEFSLDRRLALEDILTQYRIFSIAPSYKKFYNVSSVNERIEKWQELLREKRNEYATTIYLEIIENPQVKPYVGYTYALIYSEYFVQMNNLLRHTPKLGIIWALALRQKGRIELNGELIYHKYNIADVPYYFGASAPPGLTKNLSANVNFGVGDNTILSLIYTIQLPAGAEYYQTLKFQSRIKF